MDSRGKSSSTTSPSWCMLLVVVVVLLPGCIESFPVFGTKRFHRNANHQAMMPQFATPVQIFARPVMDPLDGGYYADDPSNYLYYAPHDPQYHSYGMPVYHGDYKPTPYMYAQGPTYQYYEEKEASNPLDDLHEEMLEEDEMEREQKQQRQFVQQQQQQLKNGGPFYYQPVYEPSQQSQQSQHLFDYDEENDENVNLMDAGYADANAAFLNDLIQYNRQIAGSPQTLPGSHKSSRRDFNANWDLDYAADGGHSQHRVDEPEAEGDYDYESVEHKSPAAADKAVRELEALTTKHGREKFPASDSGLRKVDPMAHHHQQQQDDYLWPGGVSSMDKDSELNNNNYEYDDGGDEWINWDSKRSGGGPISLFAFTDRKPSKVVKVPENHFVLEKMADETSILTTVSPTPTPTPKGGSSVTVSGQKEEVLMRPAPPVRNPFSAPIMKMLEHHNSQAEQATNKAEDVKNKKRSSSGSNSERKSKATVYDTIKRLLDMEQQLKQEPALRSFSSSSTSRLQKRFVSNEGSLVKQLESLKRMQV